MVRTIMEQKVSDTFCYNYAYKDAMKALSTLQSNAAYLRSVTKQASVNSQTIDVSAEKLRDTEKYFLRSGLSLEKLDALSVIHVAGTKGKGSTCAFAESILRKQGFSTGFFSSPHLVTVRERIRINGQPISQLHFTRYFWKVFEKLEATKEHETDMPTYFKFLTILMFSIFLDAKVDVAIIEVGIGGESDCTNIVRNPVCVGITSLGLEHTSLLGNTLEEIAYQKSGIFKPRTTAFTVSQYPEAMRVLEKRAVEKNCSLRVVPPFERYCWGDLSAVLSAMNSIQKQNASLAVQLSMKWMKFRAQQNVSVDRSDNRYEEKDSGRNFTSELNISAIASKEKVAMALSSCKWPGRMQVLRSSVADFYLDGAHTIESIEGCVSWFKNIINETDGRRYLIFNTSGERNSGRLLMPLKSIDFHRAYFVPNFAGVQTADDTLNCSTGDEQKVRCQRNSETWGAGSVVADSVYEVLEDIKRNYLLENDGANRAHVLVTGSLHLVGAALTILDPNLTMSTKF